MRLPGALWRRGWEDIVAFKREGIAKVRLVDGNSQRQLQAVNGKQKVLLGSTRTHREKFRSSRETGQGRFNRSKWSPMQS